jgi:hypothetical protein
MINSNTVMFKGFLIGPDSLLSFANFLQMSHLLLDSFKTSFIQRRFIWGTRINYSHGSLLHPFDFNT